MDEQEQEAPVTLTLNSEVLARLRDRFDASEERTRQGRGNMVFTYIDSRAVMDRLDEVVGPENWSDSYTMSDPGHGRIFVECRLTVLGITKTDVGEGASEDEPVKSAYSDAYKRAAVKFGIGRYLYENKGGQQNAPQPSNAPRPSGPPQQQTQAQRPAYSGGGSQSNGPASESQKRFIHTLWTQRDFDTDDLNEFMSSVGLDNIENVNISQASRLIEWLKGQPMLEAGR